MPVGQPEYSAPFLLFHPHLETICPAMMRFVLFDSYVEERIRTSDDDFLDLDWSRKGNQRLVILCHGLEGNSRRPYMKGMAKLLFRNGYDVLSWNYRGCGGTMNLQPRFYHSGATDDLDLVVSHAVNSGYESIALVGFSLGGNLVLKYAGEEWPLRRFVHAVVAISVPVDLAASIEMISKPLNRVYELSFLRSLKSKVRQKRNVLPDFFDRSGLRRIRKLREFDDMYTSKLHGFADAADYYHQCSSIRFLHAIRIPSLILNAQNDTFLSPSCYPEQLVNDNSKITLLITDRGGHVGFASNFGFGVYWSERRTLEFLNTMMNR